MTYDKIKDYYDRNLWPAAWVAKAVTKGVITADQYTAITGNVYTAG